MKRTIALISAFLINVSQAQNNGNFLNKVPAQCLEDLKKDFVYSYDSNSVLYYEESNSEWQPVYNKSLPLFLNSVKEINRLLSQKGIHLIVVPMPSRGAFIAINGTTDLRKDYRAAYEKMISGLNADGITAINAQEIEANIKDPVFLLEAHWKEKSAQAVAQAVASTLGPVKQPRFVVTSQTRPREFIPILRQLYNRCKVDVPPTVFDDYIFPDPNGAVYSAEKFTLPEPSPVGPMVWTLGPEATVQFSASGQPMRLQGKLFTPVRNQRVQIILNGQTLLDRTYSGINSYTIDKKIKTQNGLNKLVLRVNKWNHNGGNFAPKDYRPLGVSFTSLKLSKPTIDLVKSLRSEPQWSQSLTDDGLPHVLVGTSYSEEAVDNDLKFASFIRAYTGSDLANFATAGGGVTTGFRDFIESDQFKSGTTRKVIWEFPYLDILKAQPSVDQLVDALKFKSCRQALPISIDRLSGQLLNLQSGYLLRLEANSKAVAAISLTSGNTKVDLVNSVRQNTRNIFYLDTSRLGDSANTKVSPSLIGKLKVTACQL